MALPYYQSFYYFLHVLIADRIRRRGLRRILEIGCGTGQLAACLLDQGIQEYVGLDIKPEFLALAKKNAPGARFVLGDARSSELYTQINHEVVVCTEMLEHIGDDLVVVSKFLPGKRCICSVPNFLYRNAHIRCFPDPEAVCERYGRYFADWDVTVLRSPRSDSDRFFLFEGVRNEEGLSRT
jgi:SAM-dependent methyltransferase